MCGRFTQVDLRQFTDLFPWIRPADASPPPRYNLAPSHPVAVVANLPDPKIEFFQWGLVPSWAKDPSIGNRMINARAESAAQKPAFKAPFRRRRCIVPASGFYEWRKDPGGKTPMYITRRSGRPMALAGLWDVWQDPAGSELRTFTILTTDANALLASIHDRMPVILPEEHCRLWLTPGEADPRDLAPILKPFDASDLQAHPVSRLVNSPSNDSPQCVAAIEEAPPHPRSQPGLFDET